MGVFGGVENQVPLTLLRMSEVVGPVEPATQVHV